MSSFIAASVFTGAYLESESGCHGGPLGRGLGAGLHLEDCSAGREREMKV